MESGAIVNVAGALEQYTAIDTKSAQHRADAAKEE